jgi:hypothetical protein
MTGTILPPNETAIARGVAKSAAVFFVMILIERYNAGRATSEYELAALLRMDTRTVHRQLTGLSAIGLVTSQADRWMLTPEGRGTLFAENPQPTLLSIEESEHSLSAGEIPAQIVHHDMNDDELIKINDTSSSSITESTNCAKTLQILKSTALLFDESVYITPALQRLDSDFVLGWVAKAYADRARLHNPLGLLYRRLMEFTDLPVMYQKNPTRGLPALFLREIGMIPEAEKAEQAEARQDAKPVTFEIQSRSESDDENVIKLSERNPLWFEIVNQAPEIKGIAFHASEKVKIVGNVMSVFLWGESRVAEANEFIAPTASGIYAELVNDPAARVIFELEVE